MLHIICSVPPSGDPSRSHFPNRTGALFTRQSNHFGNSISPRLRASRTSISRSWLTRSASSYPGSCPVTLSSLLAHPIFVACPHRRVAVLCESVPSHPHVLTSKTPGHETVPPGSPLPPGSPGSPWEPLGRLEFVSCSLNI